MFNSRAFDVFRDELQSKKIPTLCRKLDKALCGGLGSGISELCGGPGTGKTQFCLQLCITVQLPPEIGGAGGKAMYLDTNQDFTPYRFCEIAVLMEKNFRKVFPQINGQYTSKSRFCCESMKEGLSYIYCRDYVQLMLITINLHKKLVEDRNIKLIIIDSYSSAIRDVDDVTQRSQIDNTILTNLHQLSLEFSVTVVITNEVTLGAGEDPCTVVPALGETHIHKINHRLILSKGDNRLNIVVVYKSILSKQFVIPFELTRKGIRGRKPDVQ